VNGSDVEEDVSAGTAVIPNLDAIAEFRIIASTFEAEYGEYSGSQISVVTKSGTNEFHGSPCAVGSLCGNRQCCTKGTLVLRSENVMSKPRLVKPD
jgi:hypothetical protein